MESKKVDQFKGHSWGAITARFRQLHELRAQLDELNQTLKDKQARMRGLRDQIVAADRAAQRSLALNDPYEERGR